jgi:bacterial/archaeal transporter family protein
MNGFYFAVMTAVVWGIVPVMEKIGLARIMPFSGLLIRSCGVMIGALMLSLFNKEIFMTALKADLKTVVFLVLGGFLASIVGQTFFYHALKTGEASKVVPIAGTYPLVSFLLGILFLGESFTVTKGAGVIFVIAGLFLLR